MPKQRDAIYRVLLVIHIFFMYFLGCMEVDSIRDSSSEKKIKILNDTATSVFCAWYMKKNEGYETVDCKHHSIASCGTYEIPYKGSIGSQSLFSCLGITSEPVLIIKTSGDFENQAIVDEKIFKEWEKDENVIIKNFLYSNWSGFSNGEYVISRDDSKKLTCVSKRILKMINKAYSPVALCWFYCNTGEQHYEKKSEVYTVKADGVIDIPSYASEGVKTVLDMMYLVLSYKNEADPLHADKIKLSVINDGPFSRKNFAQSNIHNYRVQGTYYLCPDISFYISPEETSKHTLRCASSPKTIEIINDSNEDIHYACYEKSLPAYPRINGSDLHYANWYAKVEKGKKIIVNNDKGSERSIYYSSNPDNLQLSNIEWALLLDQQREDPYAYYTYTFHSDRSHSVWISSYEKTK